MSMEDILKVLVDSRQQGSAAPAGSDPMTSLIGSLMGGGSAASTSSGTQPDLSSMMGLLESFMGGQSGTAMGPASDPIMALLNPFIAPLAKKANISPEIAAIVVSFVVHKLLAHHPTSGRDSNTFNLDDVLGQLNSGTVDSNLLQSSGMVNELSKKTGLNEAETEQALQLAFSLIGKTVTKLAAHGGSSTDTSSKPKSGGKSLGATGAKRGGKIQR